MKKPFKIAVSVLAVALSTNVLADNLLDVYRLAKDGDPTFLASEAGTRASSERVNQSMAGLLPQISATASYSKSETESQSSSSALLTPNDPSIDPFVVPNESESESDTTSKIYRIRLSQEIYNHSTWLGLRQSEKRELQSKINHEGTKQALIVRAAEAYFNVLAAQDSVAFSKAETEAVSKELAQTKQRFDVGLIAITDVHEAQSRYDLAIANQIAAQNGLDNAHELLQQITGQYHYDLLSLKDDIPLKNPEPEDIKEWVKKAESNNISIKASKIGMEIAKQSIDISQAGHYPTLELTANYMDSDRDTDTPTRPAFDNTGQPIGVLSNITSNRQESNPSVSLDLNIPIYSGGRTNSQVEEAQHLYVQASHNLEAERRKAVSLTRSSYLGTVAAVSSVKALKQAVVSAEKSLEATQAGFEVGTRTIVDVLQQTQILFNSKRQYARARYDYVLNILRLKQATGLLTENDLATVNKLLR